MDKLLQKKKVRPMFTILAQSISTDSNTFQGLKAQYHKEMYILSLPLRGPIKPQKYQLIYQTKKKIL